MPANKLRCIFSFALTFFLLFSMLYCNVGSAQSANSFIEDALKLSQPEYTTSYLGSSQGPNKGWGLTDTEFFNVTFYGGSVFLSLKYIEAKRDDGVGSASSLWAITAVINNDSAILPVCLRQSSASRSRALDLLERYQNWTGKDFTSEITILTAKGEVTNTTVQKSTLENPEMVVNFTVINAELYESYYWQYIVNNTSQGGIGITFQGQYLFFRDDTSKLHAEKAPAGVNLDVPPLGTLYIVVYPEPNSTRIYTDSTISFASAVGHTSAYTSGQMSFFGPSWSAGYFSATNWYPPLNIAELYLESPNDNRGFIAGKIVGDENYTFCLAKPLLPETTYTASLIYGHYHAFYTDLAPISLVSWNFTTSSGVHPTSSLTPSPETASPSIEPYQSPKSNSSLSPTDYAYIIVGFLVVLMAVCAVIGVRKKWI